MLKAFNQFEHWASRPVGLRRGSLVDMLERPRGGSSQSVSQRPGRWPLGVGPDNRRRCYRKAVKHWRRGPPPQQPNRPAPEALITETQQNRGPVQIPAQSPHFVKTLADNRQRFGRKMEFGEIRDRSVCPGFTPVLQARFYGRPAGPTR